MTCKALKVVENQLLEAVDGYSYTSPWYSVSSVDLFSFHVTFTGAAPIGTVKLQQSCDIPDYSGLVPRAYSVNTLGSYIQDGADVPTGTGINTVSVNGAGTYVLNQTLFGYAWVRVVYTAISNANTRLDINLSLKNI